MLQVLRTIFLLTHICGLQTITNLNHFAMFFSLVLHRLGKKVYWETVLLMLAWQNMTYGRTMLGKVAFSMMKNGVLQHEKRYIWNELCSLLISYSIENKSIHHSCLEATKSVAKKVSKNYWELVKKIVKNFLKYKLTQIWFFWSWF